MRSSFDKNEEGPLFLPLEQPMEHVCNDIDAGFIQTLSDDISVRAYNNERTGHPMFSNVTPTFVYETQIGTRFRKIVNQS